MSQVPDTIVLRRDRDLGARENDIGSGGASSRSSASFRSSLCSTSSGSSRIPRPARSQRRNSPWSRRRTSAAGSSTRRSITAKKKLHRAGLVLARGWLDGLTINTLEPSPVSETSHGGDLALDLGPIAAGQSYVLYIAFQVNPTNVGRQDQTATLYDGDRAQATVHRTLTVFP